MSDLDLLEARIISQKNKKTLSEPKWLKKSTSENKDIKNEKEDNNNDVQLNTGPSPSVHVKLPVLKSVKNSVAVQQTASIMIQSR